MKKMINAVFLISGTAIGAGLIALPMTMANFSFFQSIIIIMLSCFVAYQTSCMAIDLSKKLGRGTSIVELSKKLSGRTSFIISSLSLYLLSLSLLSVYFSGTSSMISKIGSVNICDTISVILCGIALYCILLVNMKSFTKLTNILFVILLSSIILVIFDVLKPATLTAFQHKGNISISELSCAIPIIFTSFGVQNVCPHICNYLEMDVKKIKLAFLIGTCIPALVYISWIFSVLISINSTDKSFFARMTEHHIEVAELINFLCNSAKSNYTTIFFKGLTLSAIATSAIGIGLGLLVSIRETYLKSKKYAVMIVTVIPAIATILIPNTFINVLSFGGMIATVFVTFMPFFLLSKSRLHPSTNFNYVFCVIFCSLIVMAELLNVFTK